MANTATAIKFDGGDDLLIVEDTSIGRIGDDENPGPFTIETWVKVDGHSSGADAHRQAIASRRGAGHSSENDGGWFWDIWSSRIHFGGNFGSESWLHGGGTNHVDCAFPTDNKWHHCVVERIGEANVSHLYVLYIDGDLKEVFRKDGTVAGTATTNFLRGADTDKMCLGNNSFENEGDTDFDGYIDEFRFSHTARYGNIDIPTTIMKSHQVAGRGTNDIKPDDTSLLITSNGTSTTSDTIVDESGVTVWTVTGAARTQTQTYLGNTAVNFDGTDDKITFTSSAFAFGTGDFSIEYWAYWDAHSNWNTVVATQRGTNGFNLGTDASSDIVWYDYSSGSGDRRIEVIGGTPLQQWTHQAWSRINGILYVWQDGVLQGRAATSANLTNTVSAVGCLVASDAATSSEFCNFHLDSMRVTKGKALYTPHFTPYGGQKNVVPNRGGAVTGARHASANTHAIQMGRAAIGSTLATSGNQYAVDFNGSSAYYIHYTPQWRSTDDRGTIFAWIYPDTVNSDDRIFNVSKIDGSDTGSDYHWWSVALVSGALTLYVRNEDGDAETKTAGTMSATAWHSIAITSDGTGYDFYIDGSASSLSSGTDNGRWIADTAPTNFNALQIGALEYSATNPNNYFDGKIMQVAYFGSDGTGDGTNGVLTAAQISALHSAGKSHDLTTATGVYTAAEIDDMHGYWRMGNHYLDTADTIYDASGNGYDMHSKNSGAGTALPPECLTMTNTAGTTHSSNWQHRGFFAPDKYTSLLIQSSTNEGSAQFDDTGPGFKKMFFDGASDYAEKTGISNYRQGDDRGTVNAWVKIKDYTSRAWFNVTDTSGTNQYWGIYSNADGLVTLNRSDTIADRTINAISTGVWTMVTVTQEPNQDTKFYVDGVLWESNVLTRGSGSPSNPALVGNERWFGDISGLDLISIGNLSYGTGPTRSDYFDGQISQVAVWSASSGTDAVLTASQISAIYDLGPGGNVKTDYSTDLVDYWSMGNVTGEGDDMVTEGSTIYSQVTSGQDLTDVSLSAPFTGHSLTKAGTALNHSTDASVYGGSSLHFDGTAVKSLVAADSNDWVLGGNSDWTLECWTRPESTSGNQCWLGHGSGTSPRTGWYWAFYGTSGGTAHERKIAFDYYNGGTAEVQNNTAPDVIKFDTWQHVAVTYTSSSNTYSHFHDGLLVHEFSNNNTVTASTGELKIGTNSQSSGVEDPFKGYIDEIRISSGISRYSKSIERFANTFVAKGDTGDAYTYLQINSNGAKNGDVWNDTLNRSGFGTTIMTAAGTANGEVRWTNTKGDPYGGANTALFFDGGGNYLTMADDTNHDFAAADDATFEVWVNFDSFPSGASVIYGCGGEGHSGNPDGWGLRYNPNTTYNTHGFYFNLDWPGTAPYTQPYTGPADNEFKQTDRWYHCAVTKQGSKWSLYTDGVLKSTVSYSPAVNTATAFRMGYPHDGHASGIFHGYIDGFRISRGIARYGKYQLRTAQQTVTSSNSDSGVITSNSTFGSANNAFETDGHTVLLLTGDELYANTLVASGAHTFHRNVGGNNVSNVTTTFATTVQASVEQVGGGTGNVFTINGALRPTDLVLVRDNHYIFHISDSNYTSHPFKFSTTNNGTHGGGTEYSTGITVDQTTEASNTLIRFSPTSATPDTLYYYCSSHSLMGGQITVTDSTGSDGKIATQPMAMFKGDGTAATGGPTQYKGVSASGANSYYYDGTDIIRTAQSMVGGGTIKGDNFDFGKEDFTIEYWEYPTAIGDHNWSIGGGTSSAQRVFEGYYNSPASTFSLVYGLGGTSAPNFNSYTVVQNEWAHIAIQGRWSQGNGLIEVWKNGQLEYATEAFTTAMNSLSTISSGSPALYLGGLYGSGAFTGFFDSWRISKGIARYGYSGTNAKLGTNAVHHSHAKLLITSNTFHGNTHFDDFSDQGNYWNQQPLSYYFDGGNDVITTTHTNNNTTHTVAIWFLWDGNYETAYNIFYDTRVSTAGGDGYLIGLYNGSYFIYGEGIASGSQITYPNPTIGSWNLVSTVVENAGGSGTIKVYVNGVEVGSGTAASACINNDGTNGTIYLGKSRYENTRYHNGRMAQFGLWSSALSAANQETLWAAGPTANWTTDFQDKMEIYYAMGNHNNLAGRPPDKAGNGAYLYDRSGNGRDATVTGVDVSAPGGMKVPNKGMPVVSTGIIHSTDRSNFGSSSIYFSGTNGTDLTIDHFGVLDTTGPFTMEWWQSSKQTSWVAFFDFRNGTNTNNLFFDHYSNNGDKLGYKIQGSPAVEYTPPSGVSDGAWHHAVLQRDSTQFRFFWDGIELGKSGGPATTDHVTDAIAAGGWSSNLIIGDNYPGTAAWKGYIDEFAMYHVAKYNPVVTGLGSSTITPSYLDDPSGNHFTTSGLAITDQMLDTPENNFCTLNPLNTTKQMSGTNFHGGTLTFYEGNLKFQTDNSQWSATTGTIGVNSGKWYWECERSSSANHSMGWAKAGTEMSGMSITGGTGQGFWDVTTEGIAIGIKVRTTSTGILFSKGGTGSDVASAYNPQTNYVGTIGFCVDFDNGKYYVSHNGIFFDGQDPANGVVINDRAEFTVGDGHWVPMLAMADSGVNQTFNFGQGNQDGENNFTDGNGRGGFRYEPPQGFLALCTANMKDNDYAPIGPNSAAGTPDKHFDVVLWTGTAVDGLKVSGLGFQPDLVWGKVRNSTNSHWLLDSVRGPSRRIESSGSGVEDTPTTIVHSFDNGGFTLGTNSEGNKAANYVAWCWKAGNETTLNDDGTIRSTTSVNQDAGFSIVSYTGTGSNGNTGHGLDSAPEFIMYKSLDDAYNWDVYHHKAGATPHQATLILNSTATTRNVLHEAVTATTIPVTDDFTGGSASGKRMIAYCWHSVEGYSKIGSYAGNGSTNGAFIYTGFRPRWLLFKNVSSTNNWIMVDAVRTPSNPITGSSSTIYADTNNQESDYSTNIDFLSNGFKARTDGGHINATNTYVYIAFAEMPFKYANAR